MSVVQWKGARHSNNVMARGAQKSRYGARTQARAADVSYRASGFMGARFAGINTPSIAHRAALSPLPSRLLVREDELVHAAIHVGRPSWFQRPTRGAGIFEAEFRANVIRAFLRTHTGSGRTSWRMSEHFRRLEATDKAMVSYFVGSVGAYLLATRLLHVQAVLHFSQQFGPAGGHWVGSGPRPDFFAIHPMRQEWYLVEAKGLSEPVTIGAGDRSSAGCRALQRAVNQLGATKGVVCNHSGHQVPAGAARSFTLNGLAPTLSVASLTGRESGGELAIEWIDPPRATDPVAWTLDAPIAALLRASLIGVVQAVAEGDHIEPQTIGGQQFRVSWLPAADMLLGIDEEIAAAVETDSEGLVGLAGRYSDDGRAQIRGYLGPSGVWVQLGESWLEPTTDLLGTAIDT
jgi:hypothetical protein